MRMVRIVYVAPTYLTFGASINCVFDCSNRATAAPEAMLTRRRRRIEWVVQRSEPSQRQGPSMAHVGDSARQATESCGATSIQASVKARAAACAVSSEIIDFCVSLCVAPVIFCALIAPQFVFGERLFCAARRRRATNLSYLDFQLKLQ
mmetsp:Transcript_3070/g.8480  ORF Transcript_3070/g.8480 Transcript_3070/m.8480 type:complete len:149 (+) Transcript_3070:1323-1769(+)